VFPKDMASVELHSTIELHLLRGDDAAARMACTQALERARAQGDRRAEADAEFGAAFCAYQADAYDDALLAAARAIGIYGDLGLPAGEAECRALVSRILQFSGDFGEALQEGMRAQALAEASGDAQAQYSALMAIANLHLVLAQWEPAISCGERAAEMARLLGDDLRQARALDTLGCVWGGMAEEAREAGDETRAQRHALDSIDGSQRALEIARRCGYRRLEGTTLANVAESVAFLGRLDEAQALLADWPVDPERDGVFTVTHHLETWGGICVRLGRHDEAVGLFRRALVIAESKAVEMQMHARLAESLEQCGDTAAALRHFKRFHALYVQASSEAAQRSARVAAVRMETADAVARAKQLSHVNEQLHRRADDLMRLSLEDPLTGLPNRRALEKFLGTGEQHWALMLIDIDHFKHVNDTHSHLVGDEVLRRLAGLLRSCCRGSDLPVRWGGEEFAILLRQPAEGAAQAAAERVRTTVEGHDWSDLTPGWPITVSVGVAASAAGSAARSMDEMLAEADRQLYAAKHGGRNRVVG